MMLMKNLLLVLLFMGLLSAEKAVAGTRKIQVDSVLVFSEDAFLGVIRKYHPVIKQATLGVDWAKAEILRSRGAFDPYLGVYHSKKTLDGEFYYSYYNPSIIVPTWYGIEIDAGLEEVTGNRVSNESTLGKTSYLGISVPLLKDLLFDKRRADLQKSQIYHALSIAEQQNTVNDILQEGLTIYWDWAREYQLYQVLTRAVKINAERIRFVRNEYLQGNRPAIDTIEALTQLQQFQVLQNEAYLRFQNSGVLVSGYLWKENLVPYELPKNIIPDTAFVSSAPLADQIPVLENLLQETLTRHPKILMIQEKRKLFEVDRKLYRQALLPQFDLKANLLNKGYYVFSEKIDAAFLENNYRYGIQFSVPLRLSEPRGALKQAQINLSSTEQELAQTQLDLENKVKTYFNQSLALKQQIEIFEDALLNYNRLLRGEETRFRIGESSLFLINARENKALEAAQKLYELKAKFNQSLIATYWAAGILF